MSINVGDVYVGFSSGNQSYKFKIIQIFRAYSAVLVECIDNPTIISSYSAKELYAIIGSVGSDGVSYNSALNSVQRLYAENVHLIGGKFTFNIRNSEQRVPVGFRYWIDTNRFASKDKCGYMLYKNINIWLNLEERLQANGV